MILTCCILQSKYAQKIYFIFGIDNQIYIVYNEYIVNDTVVQKEDKNMAQYKQYKYDSEGLDNLLIEVVKQAREDAEYYPQPRKDKNGNEIPLSKKTLREAEKIRQDAEGFLQAMRERYAN